MTSSSGLPRMSFWFSRTRSKMTIVSLIENPTMVRMPAMMAG